MDTCPPLDILINPQYCLLFNFPQCNYHTYFSCTILSHTVCIIYWLSFDLLASYLMQLVLFHVNWLTKKSFLLVKQFSVKTNAHIDISKLSKLCSSVLIFAYNIYIKQMIVLFF